MKRVTSLALHQVKHSLIILLFLTLKTTCYGQQNHILSGTIIDQNKAVIISGDLALKTPDLLTVLQYAFIHDGKFQFDPIASGKYVLAINASGYQALSKVISINEDQSITITLQETTTTLDEVTVTSKKNTITYEKGNVKVTVENSPLATLPNTLDVIAKLPTLQISPDQETITMVGKGTPLLYLDNQRITINELQSLMVDDIKTIELINNPSAKYEANGRAVLLITQKTNRNGGFKMTLSETASFKRRFSNYTSLNATLKKKKLELKGNFTYNQLHRWESNGSDFDAQAQNFQQQYLVTAIGRRPQFIAGGGFYYELKEGDYFSGNANLKTHKDKSPIITNTSIRTQIKVDNINTHSENNSLREFFSANLNFNKKIADANLFFGIQYSYHIRNLDNQIANNFNNNGFELTEIRDQDTHIDVIASKVDFERAFKNDLKLEIGGSISKAESNAFTDFKFLVSPDRSLFYYDYRENNYASYTQISGKIKKITYSAGLRAEAFMVKSGFRNAPSLLVDRKQTQFFPKAQLSLPIDSTKTVTLNYAKTIRRPNYSDANALTTFINPFLEWSGNINLRPTINNEISLDFQYKKQGLHLNYFVQSDPLSFSILYNEEQDKLIISTQNLEQESGFQIRFNNTMHYRFWDFSSTTMFLLNKTKDSTAIVNNPKPYLYYSVNNEFQLTPKTVFSFNSWGLTKRQQGIFERNALFVFSASLSQTFLKKLTVAINANDIFRAMTFEERYAFNQINSKTTYFADGQELSFSLKYAFGGLKKSTYQNKDVDENLERIK